MRSATAHSSGMHSVVGIVIVSILVILAYAAGFGNSITRSIGGHPQLIQPLLWLLPAAVVYTLSRSTSVRIFKTSMDLVVVGALIGVLHICLSVAIGFLVGMGHSPYAHSPETLLRNLWYVGGVLAFSEVARWYIVSALSRYGASLAIACTWFLFFVVSLPQGSYNRLQNLESAFPYIGQILLPYAAMSLFATYLALRGGPIASITFLGVIAGFEWFSPVLPDLSWPITALIGLAIPLLGVSVLESSGYLDDSDADENSAGVNWSWLAAALLLVLVLWFNTGVFGVRPALIQGTSMLPTFRTGDVVITRDADVDELEVGDIIHFYQEGKFVLHRIIDIQSVAGEIVLIAQGDNNGSPDPPIPPGAVHGELVMHIPKVGLPGVYFKQMVTWIVS